MPTPKQKPTPTELWTGEFSRAGGQKITLYEHPSSGMVWARWTIPGTRRRKTRSLELRIRKRPDAVDSRLKAEVMRLAGEIYDNEIQPMLSETPEQRLERTRQLEAERKGLTLRRGFDLWLAAMEPGRWEHENVRQQQSARRLAAKRICTILGERRTWESLRPNDRHLIIEVLALPKGEAAHPVAVHKYGRLAADDSLRVGYRTADVTISCLHQCSEWLVDEHHIKSGIRATMGWKDRLKAQYKRWHNYDPEVPARPRFTADEVRKLYAARYAKGVDPRMALLLIFAHARLGQALQLRRSALPVDLSQAVIDVELPGKRRKAGGVHRLSADDREHLMRAMRGYLAPLEAWYHEMPHARDYALFHMGTAGEPIPLGRDTSEFWRKRLRPSGDTAMAKWFRKLQKVAGVEPQPRRHFYGLRRFFADQMSVAAEQVGVTDTRVLLSITAHSDRRMLARYQDPRFAGTLDDAAKVRAKALELATKAVTTQPESMHTPPAEPESESA